MDLCYVLDHCVERSKQYEWVVSTVECDTFDIVVYDVSDIVYPYIISDCPQRWRKLCTLSLGRILVSQRPIL